MIYVIDHNDSFTHNVVHQFALFDKVECDNYDKINENKIKHASTIIFSPGPGNPKNYPITSKIYKKYKGKKKIIGICLGFQHILFCEGAKIVEQKKIYHGFQSNVKVITNKSLFKKGIFFCLYQKVLQELVIRFLFLRSATKQAKPLLQKQQRNSLKAIPLRSRITYSFITSFAVVFTWC